MLRYAVRPLIPVAPLTFVTFYISIGAAAATASVVIFRVVGVAGAGAGGAAGGVVRASALPAATTRIPLEATTTGLNQLNQPWIDLLHSDRY